MSSWEEATPPTTPTLLWQLQSWGHQPAWRHHSIINYKQVSEEMGACIIVPITSQPIVWLWLNTMLCQMCYACWHVGITKSSSVGATRSDQIRCFVLTLAEYLSARDNEIQTQLSSTIYSIYKDGDLPQIEDIQLPSDSNNERTGGSLISMNRSPHNWENLSSRLWFSPFTISLLTILSSQNCITVMLALLPRMAHKMLHVICICFENIH